MEEGGGGEGGAKSYDGAKTAEDLKNIVVYVQKPDSSLTYREMYHACYEQLEV